MLTVLLLAVGAVTAPAAPAAPAATAEQLMRAFGMQLPQQRRAAPLFTLPDLKGGRYSLADARGKLVLLHFWATWCVPCRHELPLLQQLLQRMDGERFQLISINVNRGDSAAVQSFIDAASPGFSTLLDPDGTVRSRYAVRGLPMSYLIGPDGRIIGRLIGERDWSSQGMKEMIQLLVNRNKHE